MHGGWLNSGEAAVVGGDDLFGGFPPARKPLTGGKPLPEKRVVPASSVPARECSPEDVDFPAANSGEAAVVGGDDLFGGFPPARPL
jgi:hypothetical protein